MIPYPALSQSTYKHFTIHLYFSTTLTNRWILSKRQTRPQFHIFMASERPKRIFDVACFGLRSTTHVPKLPETHPKTSPPPPPLPESNSVLFVQPGLIAINKSWSGFIATWAGARFRMAFSVPMMTMPDGSDRRRWWLWQSYKSHPENPSSPDMVGLGGLKLECGIIHEKMDKFLCSSTKIKSEKNLKYIENNGIWWEQYKSITLLKIDIPSRRE